MRTVAGVFALTLFAPLASADPQAPAEPPPASAPPTTPSTAPPSRSAAHARIPLRVVRVMPESHQALLFDRSRSTHVLAEVGGTVDGYAVEDIDDDEVTLRFHGAEIVLAAPAATAPTRPARKRAAPPRVAAAPAGADAGVVAPGPAAARPANPAPADPYGDPAPADRGPAPRAGEPGEGVRLAEAPGGDDAAQPGQPSGPSVHRARSGPALAGDAAPPAGPGVRVAEAPGNDAPPGNDVQPGVRVAEAPGNDVQPGVRVAEPPGGGGAPLEDAGSTGGHGAEAPASPADSSAVIAGPAAAGAVPVHAAAGAATTPAPEASTVEPAPVAPPPSDPAVAGPARPVTAARSTVRPKKGHAAAPVRSAAKPQDDARAMANLLSGGAAAPSAAPAVAAAPSTGPTVAAGPSAAPAVATAPEARTSAGRPDGVGVTLSRGDVDHALADFAKLTIAVRGSFTATGARVDGVGDGTIFQRIGLRAGDVIASVDGVPLRTLDDAANLYARAGSAKALTAQIVRNGAPITLRVAIQ